ncbi:MAG: hypothetical protein IJ113_00320 [Eggerthellaceae bacterium]|nr:hypothetical protein [Eggerthellaceae bacterium]
MSWQEKDEDGNWVEKIEVANDSDDEAPDLDDGWKYAGDNDYGSVYERPAN